MTRNLRSLASGGQCDLPLEDYILVYCAWRLFLKLKPLKYSHQFPSHRMAGGGFIPEVEICEKHDGRFYEVVHWRVDNGHIPGMRKLHSVSYYILTEEFIYLGDLN